MPTEIPGSLSSPISESFDFYSHETNLYDKTTPSFSIRSRSLPLILRNLRPDDAPALLSHYSDERNVQYDKSASGLNTLPAIESWIKKLSAFTNPLEQVSAVLVSDDILIGSGGVGWIGSRAGGTRIGDAGIVLNFEARGKGYAYEALRITFDYGFRVLGLDEVGVATQDVNVAMRGLMDKKFGFEGRRIKEDRFGNEWVWKVSKQQWFESVHSK